MIPDGLDENSYGQLDGLCQVCHSSDWISASII